MSQPKLINFDQCEMACLLVESLTGTARPAGRTAEESIRSLGPVSERFMASAEAIFDYIIQQMKNGGVVLDSSKLEAYRGGFHGSYKGGVH